MARIITIPNDNDPVMNNDRGRIVPWADFHDWIYAGYNDQEDHIIQIKKKLVGKQIEVIDCDCHGNPARFDHTPNKSAFVWGQELSRIPGFSPNTVVYLDACNTGVISVEFGGPIAQTVANGAQCTVYGTLGYMKGTFAEGTERCFRSPDGLPAYQGALDATGRAVWKAFHPQHLLNQINMNESSSINLRSDDEFTMELTSAIEITISSQPVDFPPLRMAPDITINYNRRNEVWILDVFANGGLLKERVLDRTWKVSNPEHFMTLIKNHLSS